MKHQKEAVGLHSGLALKRINFQEEKLQSQDKTITVLESKIKSQEGDIKSMGSEISKIMERLNAIEKQSETTSPSTNSWKVNPRFNIYKRKRESNNDENYQLQWPEDLYDVGS